ncbi:MAG: RidA family protein [Parcubacteria group bacterium]|nr:RidA family protein [Parcubacteria group bacterium]
MEYTRTDKAPAPGAYSQATVVEVEDKKFVYCAGQTGNVPDGKDDLVIEGGLGPQTTQALQNILAVVKAAGGDVHDITRLTVYLKDTAMDNFLQKILNNILKLFGLTAWGGSTSFEAKNESTEHWNHRQWKGSERAKQRKEFGAAYEAFFKEHGHTKEKGNMPARAMLWVSEVPLEAPAEDTVVEIVAEAVVPNKNYVPKYVPEPSYGPGPDNYGRDRH